MADFDRRNGLPHIVSTAALMTQWPWAVPLRRRQPDTGRAGNSARLAL